MQRLTNGLTGTLQRLLHFVALVAGHVDLVSARGQVGRVGATCKICIDALRQLHCLFFSDAMGTAKSQRKWAVGAFPRDLLNLSGLGLYCIV